MANRSHFKEFDPAEYLGSAQDRADYLKAMWEESSGSHEEVATALGAVARSIGMTQIANNTGVTREALYKALSPAGNPELSTFMRVLGALGLELSVNPKKTGAVVAKGKRTAAKKAAAKGLPVAKKQPPPKKQTAKRKSARRRQTAARRRSAASSHAGA
jgi:probable addiction module antidote protein